jgi:hypothetical protein
MKKIACLGMDFSGEAGQSASRPDETPGCPTGKMPGATSPKKI